MEFLPVPKPSEWENVNIKRNPPRHIPPFQQVQFFSDKEFERFIFEWVDEYLKNKLEYYQSVKLLGGSGDKSRDIIGWIIEGQKLDIYQCKHYDNKLSPNQFWGEIAKLMYYTWKNEYPYPENYYIASPKDVGPTLHDLLKKPNKLKTKFLVEWSKKSLLAIKGEKIFLTTELKDYITTKDFSVIKEKPIADILNEHEQTKYHYRTFGLRLKERPTPGFPPNEEYDNDFRYIKQLWEAFSDYLKKKIDKKDDIKDRDDLINQYDIARICFYSAECLREFTKDIWPDEEPFNDFINQIYQGVRIKYFEPHNNGYIKMYEVCNQATIVKLANNVIIDDVMPDDRIGACHILVNEDELQWVQN